MGFLSSFKGAIYDRDDPNQSEDYIERRYQYATSSFPLPEMSPKKILYPKDDDDIKLILQYVQEKWTREHKKIALAIRTGGHQYSGASSTSGENFQVDMSEMPQVFEVGDNIGGRVPVRMSVNFKLIDVNHKLRELKLFVPHGQCSHVQIGGHVQSGGYGQLTRSFGLFGDHVQSFEIITADGKKSKVTKESNPDLYFAVLGGSPGNYGILTHITMLAYKDEDFPKSRGIKILYPYSKERLKALLDLMLEQGKNPDEPADFDFCVTMLSGSFNALRRFKGLDDYMSHNHREIYGKDGLPFWPPLIVVYAQWANLEGKNQKYDPSFLEEVKRRGGPWHLWEELDGNSPTPMSAMTAEWIFPNVREFNLPYEKRAYLTTSTDLSKWGEWVVDRVDGLQTSSHDCKVFIQIQNFGGKNSKFHQHKGNGTSYSWRDSTFGCELDCFYGNDKEFALKWQLENDAKMAELFSAQDRRLLWASYGDRDLHKMWDKYYDSREVYDRLCEIKKRVDPNGIFTPNKFCVGEKDPLPADGTPADGTPADGTPADGTSADETLAERNPSLSVSNETKAEPVQGKRHTNPLYKLESIGPELHKFLDDIEKKFKKK